MKNLIIALLLIGFTVAGLEALGLETESYTFPDIFFIDENNGWIAGGYWFPEQLQQSRRLVGIIAHTTDGGNTWTVQLKNPPGTVLRKIWFSDINNGWIIGTGPVETGALLHTEDGGQNWSWEIKAHDYDIIGVIPPSNVCFIDSKEGWSIGNNDYLFPNYLLHTTDSGKSWEILKEFEDTWLTEVYFSNKDEGWIIAEKGNLVMFSNNIVLYTHDGGKNWQTQFETKKQRLYAMHFLNNKKGWIIGNNIMLNTTDGGGIWNIMKFPFSSDETDVTPRSKLPITWGFIKHY